VKSPYLKKTTNVLICVREDQTVFKVESNGNAWVMYASRTKTIDDLLYYINTMMVGREPDDFAYQQNEDHIEWID
jgi:hypothetical protein